MPPTPQITTSSSTKRPAGDELQTARAGGAQTLKARGQQGGAQDTAPNPRGAPHQAPSPQAAKAEENYLARIITFENNSRSFPAH